MSSQMADVIIHLSEDTTNAAREALRDEILKQAGVMAADHRDDKPHLMIVAYDPAVTTSKALLEIAKRRGLHAQLVGL